MGGIALAADGKLYCAPCNAADVLVIDPVSGTHSFLRDKDLGTTGGKYRSIAAAGDGKLYCAPLAAADVLVIQPFTGELSFLRAEGLKPVSIVDCTGSASR